LWNWRTEGLGNQGTESESGNITKEGQRRRKRNGGDFEGGESLEVGGGGAVLLGCG
jgi:hypothetical protein